MQTFERCTDSRLSMPCALRAALLRGCCEVLSNPSKGNSTRRWRNFENKKILLLVAVGGDIDSVDESDGHALDKSMA